MYWAIDTDVLARADRLDTEDDLYFNVISLLNAIRSSNYFIVVDHDHRILGEYRRNLNPNGWVAKFLAEFEKQRQVYSISGTLNNRIANRLRAMGFDRDDEVFVAVAHNTPGSRLVAEESDYTPAVAEYLATEGVAVLDCAGAVAAASSGGR